MKLGDLIGRLLYPPKCVLCGSLLEDEETDLCHDCRCDVPAWEKSRKKLQFLDSWAAVWYYEENVRRSLVRYKFYGARSYASVYGRLLAMKLSEQHPDGVDILTWVPVSPIRKFFRGYDQVELLAYAVGSELGITPVRTLNKIRHNRTQSRIRGEAKRRANVLGAYKVTDPAVVRGKTIVLLDDIITTGATIGECARMLLTAGALEVHGGAVAATRSYKKTGSRR